MKKWHLIIDIEKCHDCNNCFLACKDEHVGNTWPGYSLPQPRHGHRWINIMHNERGQYPLVDIAYRPTPCMHCDNAPCVEASQGAIHKRSDGIVIIDPEKAKGRKELVQSCPYGVIWWNEEERIPQKCTLCAHLLDQGWKQPRCVQACPTGALQVEFIEDNDMGLRIKQENLQVLHPQLNTNPTVYYKNMDRFDKEFIAGSIAIKIDDRIDCAEGLVVKLFKEDECISETVTDSFGDYKLDHLMENSGEYRIDITRNEVITKTIRLDLQKSVNIGLTLIEV